MDGLTLSPQKEWGLKKEKWGRWDVLKLLSEMMASASPDSSPQRLFANLSAGWSSRIKNLEIPFSRLTPRFTVWMLSAEVDVFRLTQFSSTRMLLAFTDCMMDQVVIAAVFMSNITTRCGRHHGEQVD
jgi:hypothetical protein